MGKDESRDGAAKSLRERFGWYAEGWRRAADGVIYRIRTLKGATARRGKKGIWPVSFWSRGEVREGERASEES